MKRLSLLLLFPVLVLGQATTGYHRLNQVLSRGRSGVYAQVVPNARITVTYTSTGLAATIYSNPGLSATIPNSTVIADANGNYGYYFNLNVCLTEKISYPDGGTLVLVNVCSNGGSGSATVTNFSAPSASWPTWLVPTVTNPTTTPTLTVAAGPIPFSALASASSDSVIMNASGGSAAPTPVSLPTGCINGINYNTVSHSWSCVSGGTITATGSPISGNLTQFSGPSSITNGDLSGDVNTSGTLVTTVLKVNGGSIPASVRALASNSSSQIVTASLQGSDLSLLTSGIISGVGAFLCLDSNQGATTSGCPSPMINPMTTVGDLIIGGTSGTPQRIGIGTTGQAVVVSGGVPIWGVPAQATSLAGAAAGSAPYQSATGVTSYINSPTTNGHAFFYGWEPTGSVIAPQAYDLGTYLSTNITASSPIVVSSGTLGPVISCPSCSVGSGTSLTVNGGGALGSGNLNGTTPSAGAGYQNITFQVSGSNISAEVPITTSSVFGLVKPDGSTITNTSGVFSCTTATTGQLGCVKPDGTTITIVGGVISAVGGGSGLWSGLGNPTGNLSLTMSAYTSTFTYNAATGSGDLFKITDTSSNTGTGSLFHVTSASGSSVIPWMADANGVGCEISTTGALVCFGATTHQIVLGGGTSGSGVSGSGVFTTDASGNLYSNDNNGGNGRLCNSVNNQCNPTLAQLPSGLLSCSEVWSGSGSSSALQSGDDAISNNTCYNDSGSTRTIVAIKARSSAGSNTTTVNPTFGSAGTGTTICSGALTAGSSYIYSSSCTVSNASWTTGTGIDPGMGGTLTGSSISMIVEYHY